MPGHLGAVTADAHVAPAPSSGRGAVDEDLSALVIGACPQPMRVVLGQEVGERAGDGGARLVEVVADLRHGIPVSLGIGDELVVVQAMAEDVVEVTDLLAGGPVPIVHAFRDGVDEVAKVSETLEAALSLGRVAPQPLRLHGPSALVEQAVLLEPRKQSRRLLDVVCRQSSRELERVREGHEQHLGLRWFWHPIRALYHCANHYKRLDKLHPEQYTFPVTDKNRVTSYELEREARPMEVLFVVLLVVLVDLAAIRSGVDSRPSFDEKPARSI